MDIYITQVSLSHVMSCKANKEPHQPLSPQPSNCPIIIPYFCILKSMPKIKNKGPKSSKAEASAPPPPAPPSWPAFKPSLPIVDLSPEPHPLTSKVVLIPSFFPRSLCRDYVAFLKTLPLQTTPGRPKRGEAVRVNDRFQVDSYDFASRLWEQTGLKEILLDGDVNEKW